MLIEHGGSGQRNTPESPADVGLTRPDDTAPQRSAPDDSVDLQERMTLDLLARLYAAITDAFDRGDGNVTHFGRLPNAYGGYTALSRQLTSVRQMKLRIDADKRRN